MSRRTTTVFTEALPSAGERLGAMLVVVEGPDAGLYKAIGDEELVVGTDEAADVTLADNGVSSRHFAVRRANGRFAVRDLGSKNGVVYEGSLIDERDGHAWRNIQARPFVREDSSHNSSR